MISFLEIDMDEKENDQMFLEKMARYVRSMNEVPVDRVSIPAADLLRLINMATSRMLRCDPPRIQAEEATPGAIETCRRRSS